MKLYGDLVSPYVRICLVTAYEAGVGEAVELVQTGVEVASVNAALEALSPIAQIPVLAVEDGPVLHDSRVIVDYLCYLGRESALIPGGGKERFRVLTMQAIAQGIADSAVAYRNETHQRPSALHWALARLARAMEASRWSSARCPGSPVASRARHRERWVDLDRGRIELSRLPLLGLVLACRTQKARRFPRPLLHPGLDAGNRSASVLIAVRPRARWSRSE
jgi:glutathione S-transferase